MPDRRSGLAVDSADEGCSPCSPVEAGGYHSSRHPGYASRVPRATDESPGRTLRYLRGWSLRSADTVDGVSSPRFNPSTSIEPRGSLVRSRLSRLRSTATLLHSAFRPPGRCVSLVRQLSLRGLVVPNSRLCGSVPRISSVDSVPARGGRGRRRTMPVRARGSR